MDSELRLIAALLFANENEKQEFFLKQIPPTIFLQREREYAWVKEFREKFGKYPQPIAFEHHFKEKLKRPKDPLAAVLQIVLDRSFYERIKKNIFAIKGLIDGGSSMVNVVRKYQDDANALRTFASSGTVSVSRASSPTIEAYYRERVRMNYAPSAILIDSPWPTLNKLCGLFFPKETFVLTARTSLGKTWTVMYWASYLARKGIKVLVVSYEMSGQMLEMRDESIWCQLPFENLKNGTLSPKDLARWRKMKKQGRPYELYIYDPKTERGGRDDFAKMREEIDRVRPQVVIADSYYKARHPEFRANIPTNQRMGILSGEMTPLASQTSTFFIAVVQVGRGGEDRRGRTRPSLVNIYNSDAWAQDNDYVLDISGTRFGDRRLNTLLKGRNSAVGEYRTFFSLIPPDFSEKSFIGISEDDSSMAEFTALK